MSSAAIFNTNWVLIRDVAKLYISYPEESRELAKALSSELRGLNHVGVYDALVGKPSAYWQDVYLRELASSDGVVVILTEQALKSNYVTGEIGATRALYQACRRPILPQALRLLRLAAPHLGSGLIDQSQKMSAAAMQIAEK